MNPLETFGIVPVDFASLTTILKGYSFPKDKVIHLEKKGELIRLKKGLYAVSSKIHRQHISLELIANHLYGPSYVSLETALSFYNLIPERVHSIRSMTLKRGREFVTPVGRFEYIKSGESYFKLGIHQENIHDRYVFMIAGPEKALCDLIINTSGLRIQSPKAMRVFLETDLRMDFSDLLNFDLKIIKGCIETGKKKNELTHLYKLLKQ